MKRKRGYKKDKHKHSHPAPNINTTPTIEDYDYFDADDPVPDYDDDNDNDFDSPMRLSGEPARPPVNTLSVSGGPATAGGGGRVKVKLKASKMLETHSDGQTHSDTHNSSSHLSLDQGAANDAANSLLQIHPNVVSSGNSWKPGNNIKIKSPTSVSVGVGVGPRQNISHHDPTRYNEKELNAALGVIRRVMKMDAAEPFNSPVDPVALGIPDYFDVIETPMDFGTICNNLERGHMYKNSEDVYNDVQYIWENCYKYNNKGDYIVDLMKRVKKNFMKYWTSAGLYCDQLNISNVSERHQVETLVPSSQEKEHTKGTYTKHKKRGSHGFNKHKSDCLCAVCVIRRRRREREGNANVVETQIEISDGNASQEFKQEEMSTENHFSEDASSNLECSPYPGSAADMEEESEKIKYEKYVRQGSPQEISREVEIHKMGGKDHSDQFLLGEGSGDDRNQRSQSEEMGDSLQKYNKKVGTPPRWKEEAVEIKKLQQKHDSQLMQQQTILCENLLLDRNPSIMKLCGALFSDTCKSIWNGPHSLGYRDVPVCNISSSIAAAVEMFMK